MLFTFRSRFRFFVWLLLIAFPLYCMPGPLLPHSLRILFSVPEAAADEILVDDGLENSDLAEESDSTPPHE